MPTMFARSDIVSVNIGPAHGGCGRVHQRGTGPDGMPANPWFLDCPQCTEFLAGDTSPGAMWARTPDDVPETFDEQKARQAYETRGLKSRDALMAIAMARLAGVTEIPPGVAKMLTGLPAHVPGVTVCGNGHDNSPGSRYCRECGSPMTSPAAAGSLTAGSAA